MGVTKGFTAKVRGHLMSLLLVPFDRQHNYVFQLVFHYNCIFYVSLILHSFLYIIGYFLKFKQVTSPWMHPFGSNLSS